MTKLNLRKFLQLDMTENVKTWRCAHIFLLRATVFAISVYFCCNSNWDWSI